MERRCRVCGCLYLLGYNSHPDICLGCAKSENRSAAQNETMPWWDDYEPNHNWHPISVPKPAEKATMTVTITSKDQFRRAARALGETCYLIMREMEYMPEHRKEEYINSLKEHASVLLAALEAAPPNLK